MFQKIYHCRHDYWFGVAEAVRHFYSIYGGDVKEKKRLFKALEM
jgi:hypothetical protein